MLWDVGAGKEIRRIDGPADDSLLGGIALAPDGKPQGGMGVDFGDYNRDGHLDLFVTTYQFEPNSLYSGGQGGLYQPQSLAVGLDQTTRLMVGFGTKFLDVDNDGVMDSVQVVPEGLWTRHREASMLTRISATGKSRLA